MGKTANVRIAVGQNALLSCNLMISSPTGIFYAKLRREKLRCYFNANLVRRKKRSCIVGSFVTKPNCEIYKISPESHCAEIDTAHQHLANGRR
jgi:hypothetical protein